MLHLTPSVHPPTNPFPQSRMSDRLFKRVLCVDDNTDTCALVEATLDEWDVASEFSKQEGLRRVTAEPFDLILLDYHLPDGNGLDLCRQIRTFDVSTPILLVTVTHTMNDQSA